MQCEQLQHMIVLLEEEVRSSGYEYSADFLKIAASSLERERLLSTDDQSTEDSLLESRTMLQ